MNGKEPLKSILVIIISSQGDVALRNAISHAQDALYLIEHGHTEREIHAKILEVRKNISHWRGRVAGGARRVLDN